MCANYESGAYTSGPVSALVGSSTINEITKRKISK